MKTVKLALVLVGTTTTGAAFGQMPTLMTTRIAQPAEPNAIPLYQGKAPGSESATYPEVWSKAFGKEHWVRNITKPTLTPFLPKKGKGNGAAVLVVPGGGFQFVSISNEGWPVAQALADRGIAAFVLKYRVEQTPESEAEFGKVMTARFQAPPPTASTTERQFEPAVAIARADAQTALRMIRGNAAKWGIDTKRVGMVGFSAGAMTTLATTLANAPDARPDFIAPIYGMMYAVTPPSNPQPMFAALASDDPLFNKQGFGLVESWQKAGGSVEFHYYQGGSHGFGAQKKGTTSDLWFDQFMAWMTAQGILKPVAK
jgi:acetyl esterase/lipase